MLDVTVKLSPNNNIFAQNSFEFLYCSALTTNQADQATVQLVNLVYVNLLPANEFETYDCKLCLLI